MKLYSMSSLILSIFVSFYNAEWQNAKYIGLCVAIISCIPSIILWIYSHSFNNVLLSFIDILSVKTKMETMGSPSFSPSVPIPIENEISDTSFGQNKWLSLWKRHKFWNQNIIVIIS